MDLNQLVEQLGYVSHSQWEKNVIQAVAACETLTWGRWNARRSCRTSKVKRRGLSALCATIFTDVCMTKPVQGLYVGAFVCAKAADLFISYLGSPSKLVNN